MHDKDRRRDKRRRKAGKDHSTWDLGNGVLQATPEAVLRAMGGLPPGIPTGFGIDIGPAFLVVGSSLLETWPIGPAELVATALDNLRARVRAVRPRDLVAQSIDAVPVRVLQTGVGCASALLLAPDELMRVFGPEPQCLIAPMRDLLVSLPPDADRAFVAWLNDEFSEMDPNGLALDAFVLDGRGLRYEAFGAREASVSRRP